MRRNRCDPLADTRRRHWLIVSGPHRQLIDIKPVPIGANLREAMRAALASMAAEGWRADSDGVYGFTFISRGAERRLVNLTPANPSECGGAGHAFLAGNGVS